MYENGVSMPQDYTGALFGTNWPHLLATRQQKPAWNESRGSSRTKKGPRISEERWTMHILRTSIAAATIGAMACTAVGAYPSTVTLKLYAQNRPGETGTVTLGQSPGGVKIVVTMAGGQNGSQPIHIHAGTCANPNPEPKYTLTNIVNGSSTTIISDITLGDLLKGQYIIDVHESSADITKYVACASIAASNR
jgi:hypothetical protein